MLAKKASVVKLCTRRGRGSVAAATTTAPPSSSSETAELGDSGVVVSAVGAGVWAWGDSYWGSSTPKEDNKAAFQTLIDGNVTFLDTAEVYGLGKSETYSGDFMADVSNGNSAQIATKFAPLPWRFRRGQVTKALRQSLGRLKQDRVTLYMQHWPGFGGLPSFGNESFLEGLADCRDNNLCNAIGVSNFNAQRVRQADSKLRQRGYTLATNQVQFSLLYRQPERNGVLEACKENNVTIIAYSPLAQGLLTGKYTPESDRPEGARRALFSQNLLRGIQPLLEVMREVGAQHGDKTPAQVAIRYCIDKGTLPIPGAKNARQAEQIVGSLGWQLEEGEIQELEEKASEVPSSIGAPFENF